MMGEREELRPEDVERICAIMVTADSHCPACGNTLLARFVHHYPEAETAAKEAYRKEHGVVPNLEWVEDEPDDEEEDDTPPWRGPWK